jgi:hypothetical protein
MAQPDFTPFEQLLDQIAGFCAQGHTATIMLVSDDNRMAQIHLLDGRIIFILCRGRRGRDGLTIMRTIQQARMTVDRPSVGTNEPLEWSTEVILDYLYGAINELPAGGVQPAPGLLPGAAKRPAPTPVRPSVQVLTSEHRATFERTLAIYIGPMASIVCADYFDSVTDLRTLAQKLAAEIPAPEQAAKFKADITKALGIVL